MRWFLAIPIYSESRSRLIGDRYAVQVTLGGASPNKIPGGAGPGKCIGFVDQSCAWIRRDVIFGLEASGPKTLKRPVRPIGQGDGTKGVKPIIFQCDKDGFSIQAPGKHGSLLAGRSKSNYAGVAYGIGASPTGGNQLYP